MKIQHKGYYLESIYVNNLGEIYKFIYIKISKDQFTSHIQYIFDGTFEINKDSIDNIIKMLNYGNKTAH